MGWEWCCGGPGRRRATVEKGASSKSSSPSESSSCCGRNWSAESGCDGHPVVAPTGRMSSSMGLVLLVRPADRESKSSAPHPPGQRFISRTNNVRDPGRVARTSPPPAASVEFGRAQCTLAIEWVLCALERAQHPGVMECAQCASAKVSRRGSGGRRRRGRVRPARGRRSPRRPRRRRPTRSRAPRVRARPLDRGLRCVPPRRRPNAP